MKLLIANRGEIALRVIQACRKLGISPITVYSDADKEALHVREADEAHWIGPAPAKESYLDSTKILAIAKKAKTKLIHPGYGFLSENAAFARACEKEKFIFVGPSSQTISLLGNKLNAKALAQKCGVPILTQAEAEPNDLDHFKKICRNLKFPILLKAVGGGGGKGIRIVRHQKEAESAFQLASSEALSAFKNPKLYLEPYLTKAHHIEIQVMADSHGRVVALGERECSIQRRFQKLIEESPSPFMTAELRAKMEAAATTLFKAAGYVNAGTVEFLVDAKHNFYFLEVNTRLQVEHPVTEMVYGIDLVAEQINVALGKELSFAKKPQPRGHAMELRICAEDPSNHFFPATGTIDYLQTPLEPKTRLDACWYVGMKSSLYYDSLLAKLIAWGKTREEARQKLNQTLESFLISGVQTNLPFFKQILNDPDFKQGKIHTQFVEEFLKKSKPKPNSQSLRACVAALLYHWDNEQKQRVTFKLTGQKKSKWQTQLYELHRYSRSKKIFC